MSARDLFSEEETAAASSASIEACGSCGNGAPTVGGFIRCRVGERHKLHGPRQACDFKPSQFGPLNAAAIAKREAQAGIDQAAAGAEREISGWSETAFAFVRSYAIAHRGQQYIGHDIVQASIAAGLAQPSNSKAWGAPIQRASREGLIVRVGFAQDPHRHGNPIPLWGTAAA